MLHALGDSVLRCPRTRGGCGRVNAFKLSFQPWAGAVIVHIDCTACGYRQSYETNPHMVYLTGEGPRGKPTGE